MRIENFVILKKLFYLLKVYALTVLLFITAKVVFMFCCSDGQSLSFSDGLSVIGHGLSLDLSTALYFVGVPLLLSVASVWVCVPKFLARTYYIIISFAFALAFVADTSLYPFWGFKLDASCLQYLSQPEGLTQSVSTGYIIVRIVLTALLTYAFYRLYAAIPLPFTPTRTSRKDSVVSTIVHIVLIPVMVIGIRGGFTESTTNIGQAYFSERQFLNHSAVNPVFSFLYSLAHQMGDMSQYDFMSDDEAIELTHDVYTTESTGNDTLLTTDRPDIVVILLESAGEQFAQCMPRLQQLKDEGICFSRCYANSWRTDRGTVCTLSGYPSFPTVSVMKMPETTRRLPGLAKTLVTAGYQSTYVYGGDINFTNMRSYLIGTGWQKLVSMDDFTRQERSTAKWGVRDDITFSYVYNLLTQPHDAPQIIGYSTLSSHEPWDVPTHRLTDKVENAFDYLDECLSDFVSRLKSMPQWERTLIVITADHGINHAGIDQSTPLQKNHIPMLWLGGALKKSMQVSTICNQSDIAATLLGQLRKPHGDFRFSRDVLSATYTYPTAVHNYYNAQWIVDSTGHVLYDFDARRFTVNDSPDSERLLQLSKAILQVTTHDLTGE